MGRIVNMLLRLHLTSIVIYGCAEFCYFFIRLEQNTFIFMLFLWGGGAWRSPHLCMNIKAYKQIPLVKKSKEAQVVARKSIVMFLLC